MNFKYTLLKNFLLMAVAGILLIVSIFCTNRNALKLSENELFICGQEAPKWFKDEIQKMSKESNYFKPIKVFLIKENETEYIAIEDHRKDSPEKLRIFLCNGKKVEPDEEKYASIIKKYKNNEGRIIWPD